MFLEAILQGFKMKKQIKRLSPHQNGKVFGVLMVVATMPFLIPTIIMLITMPQYDNAVGSPSAMLIGAPFLYLIFGYITVVIGCCFYNFIQKFIGGFEFEVIELTSDENT